MSGKALRTIFHLDEISDDLREYFEPARSIHPTVKNVKLNKWLATLLLPPAEYAPRRILVPFSGSGSEMLGCLLAGWEEIIGIEMESEYCAIAEARLAWWEEQAAGTMFNDVKEILKAAK